MDKVGGRRLLSSVTSVWILLILASLVAAFSIWHGRSFLSTNNFLNIAVDASPTQIEDLREGNVDLLIAQHPYDIGDRGVRKKQITTGFTTVTRENLDEPEV